MAAPWGQSFGIASLSRGTPPTIRTVRTGERHPRQQDRADRAGNSASAIKAKLFAVAGRSHGAA